MKRYHALLLLLVLPAIAFSVHRVQPVSREAAYTFDVVSQQGIMPGELEWKDAQSGPLPVCFSESHLAINDCADGGLLSQALFHHHRANRHVGVAADSYLLHIFPYHHFW
ncbi:MAG: hypothetical protein ACO1OO_13270 [Flavisolibacter sp.]